LRSDYLVSSLNDEFRSPAFVGEIPITNVGIIKMDCSFWDQP
jgi:hypothetical protein